MRASFDFGKFDFYGCGRKINRFTVTASLRKERFGLVFTACGEIWNGSGKEIVSAGQNLDTMNGFLYDNELFAEIYDLWKNYHLNDHNIGTRVQEKALEAESERRRERAIVEGREPEKPLTVANEYDKAVEYLKSVGLYIVELGEGESVCETEGVSRKRYPYGCGWVHRALPDSVVKRIEKLPEVAKANGVKCKVD